MVDNAVKKFARAIRTEQPKTKAYDSPATVTRVENGIAYIHIPGGVDETPASLTMSVRPGDSVQVRVSGGRAWITGNVSNPPTDDRTAKAAKAQAENAYSEAVDAGNAAAGAVNSAELAKKAAGVAQESADIAAEAAGEALAAAEHAQDSADQAAEAAIDAKNSATRANASANDALTQLSIVEDVAGTLSWIREHGTFIPTTDTAVNINTVYFIREGEDYTPVASPDPDKNPAEEGWYVLDVTDSQSEYIMAHLAVTSAGLWVLPSGQWGSRFLTDSEGNPVTDGEGNPIVDYTTDDPSNADGYKVLLSNRGMTVYDNGGRAVATYGESIFFDSSRPQRIGGNNVYIEYYDSDGDGVADSMNIVGAKILFSDGDTIDDKAVADIYTKAQYALSGSPSVAPASGWADSPPLWQTGQYLWTRIATQRTYVSGKTTINYSSPVYDSALTSALSRLEEIAGLTEDYETLRSLYLEFDSDPAAGLTIGGKTVDGSNSRFTTNITNTQMSFKENGETIAYINGQRYHIKNGEIEDSLTVGPFQWTVEDDALNLIML